MRQRSGLNYFAYNFVKIHRTLRTCPAMAAGVTDQLWSVEDLVTLWEAYEQRRAERQVGLGPAIVKRRRAQVGSTNPNPWVVSWVATSLEARSRNDFQLLHD